MPRIRSIKPDFFLDEDLAKLLLEDRLTFGGLWCYADREGRLGDRPDYLRAVLWPYDQEVKIDNILDRLAGYSGGKPFIIRYTIEGKKYIQINNFLKHQRPHHTEKPSLIPEYNRQLTVRVPSMDGDNPLVYGSLLSVNGKGKGSCRFAPPSLEEVTEYCKERNSNVDPDTFWNFYESKGWMIGKNKMKSWHSAIATWERKNKNSHPISGLRPCYGPAYVEYKAPPKEPK